MKDGSTITDWMQGIGTLVAVAMSGASLLWQWRSTRSQRLALLSARVTQKTKSVWACVVEANWAEKSTALYGRVKVVGGTARLFNLEALPWRPHGGEPTMILMPRRDLSAFNQVTQTRNLQVALSHGSDPSFAFSGGFGLVVAEGTTFVRIRLELRMPGRFLPLITRTMLISPSA